MRVSLLVFLFVAAATAVPTNIQKIVGGVITNINQHPYAAALLYSAWGTSYSQSCGGTIINSRSILSAAHCLYSDGVANWRARVGSTWASSGGTVYSTAQLIINANYNRYTSDNDVAILRVSGTFIYGTTVGPASIPGSNYVLLDNQVVWAIGWGTTYSGGSTSEELRQVQIWTVNQTVCKSRYASIGANVTDNMLCSGWLDVGGRDQCQGDSGGPLLHNKVVVGICSWGAGCGQAYYPGVNTRVSKYTSWILSNA